MKSTRGFYKKLHISISYIFRWYDNTPPEMQKFFASPTGEISFSFFKDSCKSKSWRKNQNAYTKSNPCVCRHSILFLRLRLLVTRSGIFVGSLLLLAKTPLFTVLSVRQIRWCAALTISTLRVFGHLRRGSVFLCHAGVVWESTVLGSCTSAALVAIWRASVFGVIRHFYRADERHLGYSFWTQRCTLRLMSA